MRQLSPTAVLVCLMPLLMLARVSGSADDRADAQQVVTRAEATFERFRSDPGFRRLCVGRADHLDRYDVPPTEHVIVSMPNASFVNDRKASTVELGSGQMVRHQNKEGRNGCGRR